MNFQEYQMKSRATAVYNMVTIYPTLGLCGEVGEFANKIKKVYRDYNGRVSKEMFDSLLSELGDVLWYVANCATDLGMDLNSIAERNIKKLEQRKINNKIHGEGDKR